jgi:hypothetical protein
MKILATNNAQDFLQHNENVKDYTYTTTDGRIIDLENGIFFNSRLFSEKDSSIHNVAQTISDKLLSYKKKVGDFDELRFII